ncbi:helix-turn-helix domain-containing protein [Actinoplanes sp. NPDC023936]|uniref:helix-turn-helix domain-containing protein n=1 Tax=Actinoplanes sp. NPDC023936 TaxID=3154910 RepID=UPI00340FAC15
MTDDVRDRILGLLHAGPATVAGLSARLGLPGGVVSYHLKILEQGGLVRAGASRVVQGVAVPRYVSTAAAAAPPLRIPTPLPGLTWTGTGRFPVPVWTVGAGPGADAAIGASGSAPAHSKIGASGSAPPEPEMSAPVVPAGSPPGSGSAPATPAGDSFDDAGTSAASVPRQAGGGQAGGGRPSLAAGTEPPYLFAPEADVRTDLGPRLVEVRRVPLDDATFYEFATRLDALTREFAARATAGAPAAELAIALYRPTGEGAAGHGS